MKAKVNYLLVGKVFCAKCGSLYNGNSYRNTKSKDNTLLSYYKCSGKCGNTSIRKDNLEAIVIEQLVAHCFSPKGMSEIIIRVKELYQKHKKTSSEDVLPIQKEIKELDTTIDNWIQALGKGIRGLENKIVEAQNRQELLKKELHQNLFKKHLLLMTK